MTSSRSSAGAIRIRGKSIALRPLAPADQELILDFARQLPRHDLLFLHRDITNPIQVAAWLGQVEAGLIRTSLAIAGGAIVGYSSVERGDLHWTRDTVDVRVLVADEYRGQGLGRILLQWAFDAALEGGARKLLAQMTADQEGARKLFERLGFSQEARLRDHVTDVNGALRDLVVMSFFPSERALPACQSCGRPTLTRLKLGPQELCWDCFDESSRELGGGG